MSKIAVPGPAGFLQILPSTEISGARSLQLPELSVGETVEAAIVRQLGTGRFVVQLKDALIPARSDLAFRPGDRVSVAVEGLHPEVLLRITGGSAGGSRGVVDFFPGSRLGATSLLNFFVEASNLLKAPAEAALLPGSESRPLDTLLALVRSLVVSRDTFGDPLFIRNYILNLGLLYEKRLHRGQKAKEGAAGADRSRGSLKGLLLELAGEPGLPDDGPIKGGDGTKTGRSALSGMVESGLGAIESEQWLNLFLQETENRYVLSIPFLMDGRILMQNLEIRFNKDGEGAGEAERPFHVTLYLDLDILGRLIADVAMRGDRIGCALRFEEEEGCRLFSPCLEDLGGRLKMAGYKLDYLSCARDPMAAGDREIFKNRLLLHTLGEINCFA